MSVSMQLIICTFDAATRASEVHEAIRAWDRQIDAVRLGNVAIVQKSSDGQISFRETEDIGRELSNITGAIAGGVAWFVYAFAGSFGQIAGPWARFRAENSVRRLVGDMGFPDYALEDIGNQLDAGSSALITLVQPGEAPLVRAELQRLGGTIVEHEIAPEIVAELLNESSAES